MFYWMYFYVGILITHILFYLMLSIQQMREKQELTLQ
jgi:hypothetical protein